MHIELSSKMEKFISTDSDRAKHFGKLAKNIRFCLSVMCGADSLEEVPNVPPTRRHKLKGLYAGCWGLDLGKSWRMIIRPNPPETAPKNVKSIVVIDIVDYH
jgi:plasmid maintenance system killer protein